MIRNVMIVCDIVGSSQDATDDDTSLCVWYAINPRHVLEIQKICVGNNVCQENILNIIK